MLYTDQFAQISKISIYKEVGDDIEEVFNYDRGLDHNELPVEKLRELLNFVLDKWEQNNRRTHTRRNGWFNAVWACSGRYHVEAKIYTEPSKYGIVFTSNNVITDGFSRTRSGRIYDA